MTLIQTIPEQTIDPVKESNDARTALKSSQHGTGVIFNGVVVYGVDYL